jgi:RNA polymerase sigma-70 factor (ECF subfamily)
MTPMENDYQPVGASKGQPRGFATTHWSLVLAAGERGGAESDRALEQLCRAYWTPLYAYVRRRVSDVHEAQDLTQAFFERLLEKRYLAQANPQRGRFRSFLITAFKHFLAKEWERARAEKRGGGQVVLSFDFAAHDCAADDATDQGTPERAYERQWAIALLNRVMDRLQREMERSGKGRQFQTLKEFIGGANQSSYVDAAVELGMSESAARMATSRLRGRYRELLRDEIANTVSAQDEIDEEIRDLFVTFTE